LVPIEAKKAVQTIYRAVRAFPENHLAPNRHWCKVTA